MRMIVPPRITSHRGCQCRASLDAIAAATPSPAANGATANPLSRGEYRRIPCRYREMNTARHMTIAPASTIAPKAATRLGLANTVNGRIGLAARCSTITNATSSTAAATAGMMTIGRPQPLGPSLTANTAAVTPNVASIAPGTSSPDRGPSDSRRHTTAPTATSIPIGTLIRKTSRHDSSVSTPPATSPATDPTPLRAA